MAGFADASKYEALVIFPNLILAPLPDMTFSIVMLPDSAQRTRERLEFLFVGEEALQDRYRALREKGAPAPPSLDRSRRHTCYPRCKLGYRHRSGDAHGNRRETVESGVSLQARDGDLAGWGRKR